MKRIIIFLLLLTSLIVTSSCQTVEYPTPQTVAWDAPTLPVEYTLDGYEVAVLHSFDDKGDPGVYQMLSVGLTIEELLIDLEANSLYGVFIVSVRSVVTRDDTTESSDWAYSDVQEDVAVETFYIINHPQTKPRLIRIRS